MPHKLATSKAATTTTDLQAQGLHDAKKKWPKRASQPTSKVVENQKTAAELAEMVKKSKQSTKSLIIMLTQLLSTSDWATQPNIALSLLTTVENDCLHD
ncbi:MAG: hypothetical protein MMC33_008247 [Icmadophila ericetorum]|nr:hypothetical protein [Icmadophila ericetorum]